MPGVATGSRQSLRTPEQGSVPSRNGHGWAAQQRKQSNLSVAIRPATRRAIDWGRPLGGGASWSPPLAPDRLSDDGDGVRLGVLGSVDGRPAALGYEVAVGRN